jgi:hypothetical protein
MRVQYIRQDNGLWKKVSVKLKEVDGKKIAYKIREVKATKFEQVNGFKKWG